MEYIKFSLSTIHFQNVHDFMHSGKGVPSYEKDGDFVGNQSRKKTK